MAHLWTDGPCPPEYLELFLCRDVYHCTPPQLQTIPPRTLLTHLTCLNVEAEVKRRRER